MEKTLLNTRLQGSRFTLVPSAISLLRDFRFVVPSAISLLRGFRLVIPSAILLLRKFRFFVPAALLLLQFSCSTSPGVLEDPHSFIPPKPDPEGYVCYRTTGIITVDGILNESDWEAAPWTNYFVDIEGDLKPVPHYKTRLKMLWDDEYLYIAAEMEEQNLWATLRQRDTVIFIDNDFEVFIDPDGDTHNYYELEVNAFGTSWDLLLIKPYRDGGPAVTGWDIKGLKVGTRPEGTINDPRDTDRGWSVEFAIPFNVLRECNRGPALPRGGDHWRINFSRVQWRTVIEDGRYRKETDPSTGRSYPEYNWVWSPQGRINMHMPEMWGYMQFSGIRAGAGTETFVPDKDLDEKWALRMVYYLQHEYFRKFGTYTSDLKSLGLVREDFEGMNAVPVINATRTTYECYFDRGEETQGWTIYHDGKIVNLAERP